MILAQLLQYGDRLNESDSLAKQVSHGSSQRLGQCTPKSHAQDRFSNGGVITEKGNFPRGIRA